LAGKPVCIHSSIKSFGGLEGGPGAIIDACLERDCTLVVPAFTYMLNVSPPPDQRPRQNGRDYSQSPDPSSSDKTYYRPEDNIISAKSMGALPVAVLEHPARVRGDHPLNSFAALGPRSQDLIQGQGPDRVYYPLEQLAQEGGFVILMGVDYTSLTLIHLAEHLAGRRLFKAWALDSQGKTIICDVGSCSNGFMNFASALDPVLREARVGESLWKILPAKEALDAAAGAIKVRPDITRCADNCLRCQDSIKGGPIFD